MKKASSRSQRGNKGIKGKHVLQICVLLGVCIWLIYQVKYSHDKKKEFYEKDGEKSLVLEREDGLVKLGRKDLLPGYHNNKNEKPVEEDEEEEEVSHGGEEIGKKSKVENGNHEEEEKEDEEEVVEEDEEDKNKQGEEVVDEDEEDKNKQGEEVVEEDEEENKHEEDEIDEQDGSKSGGDNDKDDELLEEEKESGLNEKEKESNRANEINMTVDEARDEHYKADDASSAVSHDSRILKTEKLKESSENTTESGQENNSNGATSQVKIEKEPVLKLGEVDSGESVEKTTTEVKDGDSETKNAVTELIGETVHGNSTEAILEASRVLQNETEIMQDRSQDHVKTEDGAPPAGFSNLQTVFEVEQIRNESNPNITVSANITNQDSIQDESRNTTSESSLIENISGSNTTEVKENAGSEGEDESGEKDSSNLDSADQTEEAEDTTETSISQEEREALLDPQTLPDIRIEGNEEDEEEALAAE